MRHDRCEKDINRFSGAIRLCRVPEVEVALLQLKLLLVQLPVLVDGDGLSSVDEGFYVRNEWLSTRSNISPDVFTTVCCVVLILILVSSKRVNRSHTLTMISIHS